MVRHVVSAHRKLTDADVEQIRALAGVGWTHERLAETYGVSRQHIGRLLAQEQRPVIAGLDRETVGVSVSGALGEFLAGMELDHSHEVLAATARALAAKLDAATAAESATAAAAVPRLADQLVEVLDRLRAAVPREPDRLEQLKARRAARRLAMAAQHGNGNGGCPE